MQSHTTARQIGLPPVISSASVLLVLGSFPGTASLAAQQYYAHPRNDFWRILAAIWPEEAQLSSVSSYEIRSACLLRKGLGLWDVYASCERAGSLDSAIRKPVANDIATLRLACPQLRAIAHNGALSFQHATPVDGLAVHKLPSTSPANAAWSFARKLAAWRAVLAAHSLVAG